MSFSHYCVSFIFLPILHNFHFRYLSSLWLNLFQCVLYFCTDHKQDYFLDFFVQICNPIYLGIRDQEGQGEKQAQEKCLLDPFSMTCWAWWHAFVSPAVWQESTNRKMLAQAGLIINASFYLKNNQCKKDWHSGSMVTSLPSKCKALLKS
jgi:hypothetical protein